MDFKEIKFSVKIRDIPKTVEKNSSVFLVIRIKQSSQSTFQKILLKDISIHY